MRRLGIDEAGRGCVLGALYVGAFLVEAVDERALRDAGAADSKALTHAKRVAARERLAPLGTAMVTAVPATTIDAGNLNTLEEDAIAAIIDAVRPDEVYIDALGHPRTFDRVLGRFRARAPYVAKWVMEPKADATFALVGAASIFAKTERDAALAALASCHGELGSGYPSDPVTRAWLASWAGSGRAWPEFVRTRWGTIEAMKQGVLI